MAGRKRTPKTEGEPEPEPQASVISRRLVNLLALIAVKGEKQADQILILASAGFTPAEIATLLRTTANNVSVTLYNAKTKGIKGSSR